MSDQRRLTGTEAADDEIDALKRCYAEMRVFDRKTISRMLLWLDRRFADEKGGEPWSKSP